MARIQYDADAVATRLIQVGRLARTMPPAYAGAGVAQPVIAEGRRMGWALPGTGLLLDVPLRKLGIVRRLPHVYERDPVARLAAWLNDERGAVGTYQAMAAARAAGMENDVAYWPGTTGNAALWNVTYRSQNAGSITYPNGTSAAPNNQNVGATRISDPAAGTSKYLVGWGLTVGSGNTAFVVMLIDVLVVFGRPDPNVTTTQTVNTTALTRYTSGAGVLLTFDAVGALGSSPANLTVTYTNQNGTAGQTTTAAMTPSAANISVPFTKGPFMPLAPGDYGVRSVQSLIFSAAMGAAGTLGGLLYYPLAVMPLSDGAFSYERKLTNQIDGLTLLPTGTDGHVGFISTLFFGSGLASGGIVRTVQA